MSGADRSERRDCASAAPHEAHEWTWDGGLMWCEGKSSAAQDREIPFWAFPPVFLVIVIAVVLFPFRFIYERLTGR